METLWNDLKYGMRTLKKDRGFTALAVITLALGIGLNTAVFSLVNAVLFKPLPAKNPDELVTVWNETPNSFLAQEPMGYPDFADLREQNRSFSALSAYALFPVALDLGGESQMVIGQAVSGNYFDMLGARAARGRAFQPEEDRTRGTHPVVVLSDAAWHRRFGARPDVVGQTVRLNGNPFTVIGVAEPRFTGVIRGFTPEFWLPMAMIPTLQSEAGLNTGEDTTASTPSETKRSDRLSNRRSRWLFVMGRLKPGVTYEESAAEMKTLGRRLSEQFPDTNKDREVSVLRATDVKVMPGVDSALYTTSFVLMALVGFVLLIASANVANMLLARAASRRREVTVRLSIGASRFRVVRQLVTESVLLALAGSVLGLVLAAWSNSALNSIQLPLPIQVALNVTLDFRVLAFTCAVAFVTAVAFGLPPAFQASRVELAPSLRGDSGTTTGGTEKRRLRDVLVVAQVATSLVLLVGAGLSLRSMTNAFRIDPGFDPSHLVEASVVPSLQGYNVARAEAFYAQLSERAERLPGVVSVATASSLPLSFEINVDEVSAEGREPQDVPDGHDWPDVDTAQVGPGYFETLGIPILRGRAFGAHDDDAGARVAVVNQTLADGFWPGQDPIGKRLRFKNEKELWEVVGVARNGKYRTLGETPRPYLYRTVAQTQVRDRILLVRVNGEWGPVLAGLRNEIRQLDPKVPVIALRPVEETVSVVLLLPRAGAALFGLFGVLGLVLASVGLYGVITYMVGQRTREIGIRVALGADRQDVLRLVVGRGLALTAIGVALGLTGAVLVTRILSVLLYGISPTDPLTFAGVSILLMFIAGVACFIPARHAMRVNPVVALHYE